MLRGNPGAGRVRVVPVTRPDWEREYADYVTARSRVLCTTAYLLCGDWHRAEDVTQTALTKLYLAWRRIDRSASVDAYARTVLLRAYLDEGRRPWRRERTVVELPDPPAPGDAAGEVDDRLAIAAVLRRLPRTQRAVIVLRFWCDLDVRSTAAELGISEGTVKSASARGLASLRAVLEREGIR
jgi:RNA polymerase sigma-70 factor (sigma-E family)